MTVAIPKEAEMKIDCGNSDLNVIITRNEAGYSPEIWLCWRGEIALTMTIRLTADEARELAQALLCAADQAQENKRMAT
jgi:hypothetical protein